MVVSDGFQHYALIVQPADADTFHVLISGAVEGCEHAGAHVYNAERGD